MLTNADIHTVFVRRDPASGTSITMGLATVPFPWEGLPEGAVQLAEHTADHFHNFRVTIGRVLRDEPDRVEFEATAPPRKIIFDKLTPQLLLTLDEDVVLGHASLVDDFGDEDEEENLQRWFREKFLSDSYIDHIRQSQSMETPFIE